MGGAFTEKGSVLLFLILFSNVFFQIKELDSIKPVIYGGDLNVAHNEIGKRSFYFVLNLKVLDLANPTSNRNKTAGFTDKERAWFTDLLAAGFKVSLLLLDHSCARITYTILG